MDDTGRRARLLTGASLLLALLVVVLLVTFWVGQATSSGAGLPGTGRDTADAGQRASSPARA